MCLSSPYSLSYVLKNELYQPTVGITQSVRLSENNKIYLNTDRAVDFADREFTIAPRAGRQGDVLGQTIPLVNPDDMTIAGVRVNNFAQSIQGPLVRGEIFMISHLTPIDERVSILLYSFVYIRTKSSAIELD